MDRMNYATAGFFGGALVFNAELTEPWRVAVVSAVVVASLWFGEINRKKLHLPLRRS